MNDIKYLHNEAVHNFKAPNEIVPFVINLLNPKSVVDIGCGIGTWLAIFKEHGVQKILGLDGSFVDKKLLKIHETSFKEVDLEKSFELENKFDLAISLEVAEHISFENSDVFIKSICNLSDLVIFSAAIPNQGGQNHINEQPPMFWIQKFELKGYKAYDVIRPVFWNNVDVDWWYKQNIFIFSKNKDINQKLEKMPSFYGAHLAHPIILKDRSFESSQRNNEIVRIESGFKNISFYFKILKSAIVNKIFNK